MNLNVEYLITVKADSNFCADKKGFNKLLETSQHIEIKEGKIIYKDIEVKYDVNTKALDKEKHRFFYTRFQFSDVSKLVVFESLLRDVKEVIYTTGNTPQTLWDDISFYYSKVAYPLIFEVENLMRKLITKFMLTNVGIGWAKDNIPTEVKDSVKGPKDETPDFLYKVDFIQINNFLFKEYSPQPVKKLMEIIKNSNEESILKIDELKTFVPSSNWEKYFSELVDCDAEYLRKRWEKLYKLRNNIAHNRGLIRREYEEIVTLVDQVKDKLNRAINSLDQITLTTLEKEMVVEESILGESISEFLNNCTILESLIREKFAELDIDESSSDMNSYVNMAEILHENNRITTEELHWIGTINYVQKYILLGGSTVEHSETFQGSREVLPRIINDLGNR